MRFLEETLLLSTSIDITRRKQVENELARRAYSDDLTGFANRTMIQEHVEQILRGNGGDEHFALAFIDLDNFKQINDTYGHAIGDIVLVEFANRLRTAVRPGDTVARLGGDEFVILCEDVDEGSALAVAERLNITVCGYLRQGSMNVYTHTERFGT